MKLSEIAKTRYPGQGSSQQAAEEGRHAHEAAERIIRGESPEIIEQYSENSNPEFSHAIRTYTEYAFNLQRRSDISACEVKLHTGIQDCWGTSDFVAYSAEKSEIEVVDFKFGRFAISPEFNWQGILYGIGAFRCIPSSYPAIKSLRITIVQPRVYGKRGAINSWEISAEELKGYYLRSEQAAAVCLQNNPPVKTGPYCRYCIGKPLCTAFEAIAWQAIDYVENAPTYQCMPGLEMALDETVLAISRLEEYKAALETELQYRISTGNLAQTWTLKPGYGRRVWKDENIAAIIASLYGYNISKTSVITPYQAELLGLNKEIITDLTQREPGKTTLAKRHLKGVFESVK